MTKIDLSYLKKISDNNQQFIKEMIESFLDCAPQYLEEIQSYSNQQDWTNVHFSAHKLKPSATYVGLPQLLKLILEVEAEVKSNQNTQRIHSLVEEMKLTCQEAYPKLRDIMQQNEFD